MKLPEFGPVCCTMKLFETGTADITVKLSSASGFGSKNSNESKMVPTGVL